MSCQFLTPHRFDGGRPAHSEALEAVTVGVDLGQAGAQGGEQQGQVVPQGHHHGVDEADLQQALHLLVLGVHLEVYSISSISIA